MTQWINKYIHKYAKHLSRMKKRKDQVTFNANRKKKSLMDGLWNQPKYSLKRHLWPAQSGTWQTELPQCNDENGCQVSLERLWSKRRICPLCQYEIWRPSFSHRVNSKEREFPQDPGDVSESIIWEPCTQNYLITVHMFIYSTTTSICAFWTVTKWCFIACCIDDANYNCSSTILE